jgi:hypothetical protein
MGFIKDIEDMPNQLEYSKTFFSRWYRPEYTTVIVAGDVKAGRNHPAGREVLGRLEARQLQGRDPAGAPAEGARVRAPALDEPDAPVGLGRLPRPGLLRHEEGLSPRPTCSSTSPSGRPRTSQEARRAGAEGRPDVRRQRRDAGPRPLDRLRARQEDRGRGLRPRRDPADLPQGGGRARGGPAPRGSQVKRPLRLRPASSTTPRRSPRRSRASCATAGPTTR